eukprot:9167350-Ditylum_brightwellii.AAC.1
MPPEKVRQCINLVWATTGKGADQEVWGNQTGQYSSLGGRQECKEAEAPHAWQVAVEQLCTQFSN